MYAEKQYDIHPGLRRVQWLSLALGLGQLTALIAAEAGRPWLPLGYVFQIIVLATTLIIWLVLKNARFSLRVSNQGWDLRYFPFQLHFHHIDWAEIKQVGRVSKEVLPQNAPFGLPLAEFTRIYLLSSRRYELMRIDLVNGGQLLVSTKNVEELTGYLQKTLLFVVA